MGFHPFRPFHALELAPGVEVERARLGRARRRPSPPSGRRRIVSSGTAFPSCRASARSEGEMNSPVTQYRQSERGIERRAPWVAPIAEDGRQFVAFEHTGVGWHRVRLEARPVAPPVAEEIAHPSAAEREGYAQEALSMVRAGAKPPMLVAISTMGPSAARVRAALHRAGSCSIQALPVGKAVEIRRQSESPLSTSADLRPRRSRSERWKHAPHDDQRPPARDRAWRSLPFNALSRLPTADAEPACALDVGDPFPPCCPGAANAASHAHHIVSPAAPLRRYLDYRFGACWRSDLRLRRRSTSTCELPRTGHILSRTT